MLAAAWPELRVVAECEDGPAAVEAQEAHEAYEAHAPQVAFLDIRMPGMNGMNGMNGLDVARAASGRCHSVFTIAYDSHRGRLRRRCGGLPAQADCCRPSGAGRGTAA